jgi:hypothetical protein
VPDLAELFRADKSEGNLLVLFIPSANRKELLHSLLTVPSTKSIFLWTRLKYA